MLRRGCDCHDWYYVLIRELDMKKVLISVGMAFVCVVAFMDYAQYEHHLKERREAIMAGTYDGK